MAASGFSDASLRGIARFAHEHDWHVSADLARLGALPCGWRGDGILVSLPQPPEILAQLATPGVPCVTFSETGEAVGLPIVAPDDEEIGRLAADHLLERAHRNFACAPLVDGAEGAGRFAAFRRRIVEHGFTCHVLPPLYVRRGRSWRHEEADRRCTLIGELRRLPRPIAIFAFDDSVSSDLVDACREAGISIPEDVAVLGVGNSIFCTTSSVPLSSVDLDLEQLGYRAAELLEAAMSGLSVGPLAIPVRPKGVITRVSTDVIAVSDSRVARALSYIAEHYPETGLSVDAVARAVGMSRRSLERSFRQETGRTIHEYIVNVRMREASRLLAASPKTRNSEIAAFVGLAGERNFFRVFRRHFGMSPKAHRNWTAKTRLAVTKPDTPVRSRVTSTIARHPLTPGADFTAA